MASSRVLAISLLKGENYSTWRIQCKMALLKDSLWSIVTGTEEAPPTEDAEKTAKYQERKDKALTTIVLAVDVNLLYSLGEPEDPKVVWEQLAEQFQRKSWANKLALKRKLFAMRLEKGGDVQSHVKRLTETLDELSVVDEPVKEDDRVVYLLASLPEEYDMLVTALEASAEVPKMSMVLERLRHDESKKAVKTKGKEEEEALVSSRFSRHQGRSNGRESDGSGQFSDNHEVSEAIQQRIAMLWMW